MLSIRNSSKEFQTDFLNATPTSNTTKQSKICYHWTKESQMLGSLIIPKESRQEVLNKLHALHQGIEKTKRRAKESVYWPNIDGDIKKHINFCSKYQTSMPSQQKETLLSDSEPCRICEEVSSDLFSYGGKYYRVYGN